MDRWVKEIQLALRTFARKPGFAATVIITLGLGIGATTGVFSLVHGILIEPLPYPDENQLVGFWFEVPSPTGPSRTRQSEATYVHFARNNQSFEAFGLARGISVTYQDTDRPVRVRAATVTPSIFDVLQINPTHGRRMTKEEGAPGGEPVTVLSHDFWRTHFGGDDVVGRVIEIDGVMRRIVGVLPGGIRFPEQDTDIWIPHVIDEANPVLSTFFYEGYGRLKENASIGAATADAGAAIRTLPDAYPAFFRPEVASLIDPLFIPLRKQITGDVRSILWILFGASLTVLTIATANVANLFIVRSESRSHEIAVRHAMGAGSGRIVQHLLTESCVMAALGAVLGVVLAGGGIYVLAASGQSSLPRLDDVSISWIVLGFAALISLLVGLSAGATPALRITRRKIADVTRAGMRSVGQGRQGSKTRHALVVAQVALAMVLLVGAGLLLRTFASLRDTQLGFVTKDVVGMRISLPQETYGDWTRVNGFYRQLLDGVRRIPGVQNAAAVTFLPLRDGRVFRTWILEGQERPPDEIPPVYLSKVVSEDYFETMRIPLLAGRTLHLSDHDRLLDPPIVVSSEFAIRSWPGQEALGKRIQAEKGGTWFTVVGVVGDVRDRTLVDAPAGMVYLPLLQRELGAGLNWREMSLAVRAENPNTVVAPILSRVAALDPKLPVYDQRTMEEVTQGATARTRFTLTLLLGSSITALFLGAVGLYGVLAYLVGQRRREIGLRIALGSSEAKVRNMVVRKALTLTLTGVLVGSATALAGGKLIETLLFGVTNADPATFFAVAVILMAVCWLAASVPAYRASRIDPVVALKGE